MVGELIQGAVNEFRDEHDASDPLTTVGRFVGSAFDLEAMSELVEIAGNMDGGLDGVLPEVEPAPDLQLAQNNTNTMNGIDPMMASGPSFGNPYT